MPKYWGKQIFSLGSFPEMGQNQKKKKRDQKLVITMASYALQTPTPVAHASCMGQDLHTFYQILYLMETNSE